MTASRPYRPSYGRKLPGSASCAADTHRSRNQSPLGQRPLLVAHPHCQKLLDGRNPLGIGGEEGIIPHRVLGPLDVGLDQRMRGILEPVVCDIARCHAQEAALEERKKTG